MIFANDLPYTTAEVDPKEALKSALAFSVDDWGSSRAMAWVYGIILGWDDNDEPVPLGDAPMREMAEKFRWDEATVARLRLLHQAFEELGRVIADDK